MNRAESTLCMTCRRTVTTAGFAKLLSGVTMYRTVQTMYNLRGFVITAVRSCAIGRKVLTTLRGWNTIGPVWKWHQWVEFVHPRLQHTESSDIYNGTISSHSHARYTLYASMIHSTKSYTAFAAKTVMTEAWGVLRNSKEQGTFRLIHEIIVSWNLSLRIELKDPQWNSPIWRSTC